jgi:hypothetical protein
MDDLQKTNEQNGKKEAFENPEKEKQAIEQQMEQSSESLKKEHRKQASKSQQSAANK